MLTCSPFFHLLRLVVVPEAVPDPQSNGESERFISRVSHAAGSEKLTPSRKAEQLADSTPDKGSMTNPASSRTPTASRSTRRQGISQLPSNADATPPPSRDSPLHTTIKASDLLHVDKIDPARRGDIGEAQNHVISEENEADATTSSGGSSLTNSGTQNIVAQAAVTAQPYSLNTRSLSASTSNNPQAIGSPRTIGLEMGSKTGLEEIKSTGSTKTSDHGQEGAQAVIQLDRLGGRSHQGDPTPPPGATSSTLRSEGSASSSAVEGPKSAPGGRDVTGAASAAEDGELRRAYAEMKKAYDDMKGLLRKSMDECVRLSEEVSECRWIIAIQSTRSVLSQDHLDTTRNARFLYLNASLC